MSSHEWDTAIDPAIVPLFLALQRCHARAASEAGPVLEQHSLTPAEFDVLATLRNAPPPHRLCPGDIAKEVVITSGGLTKVMRQLEAKGHVTRSQTNEDLRQKPVQLTAAGRHSIEAAMHDSILATRKWILGSLEETESVTLRRLLNKLCKP